MNEAKRENAAAVALIALGAVLRLAINNVTVFSRADEMSYLLEASALQGRFFARFPEFVREYVSIPDRWSSPPPVRWGHWALISDACALSGQCSFPTLTFVSTLAGIAALVFTWLLGRELVGARPALVALVLSLTAPLQLHLGRRALQDEIACAAALAALWAFARAVSSERRDERLGPHLVFVLCGTWALAEKETAILWAAPMLALWLSRLRARGLQRRDLLLLLPPLLDVACFDVLARSPLAFFRVAQANLGSLSTSDYVVQQMSGPPYRYLLDLFILAPLPVLLGLAAGGALLVDRDDSAEEKPAGARELAMIFWLAVLLWAPTPKDVRYFAAADALIRLLAGWLIVRFARRGRSAAVIAAVVAGLCLVSELRLFERIFVQRAVYDPTTYELLRAVDAIPR